MPREAESSLNEQAFVLKALREGIRLDGRAPEEFRNLTITFGGERGRVDVRLGRTRIVTRISSEITCPFLDRKFEGIFTISTEFSPMASPAFETGRSTTVESLISRYLEKALRRSSALDTESLCIVAGSKCFAIRADVHVLVHDGNLLDAASIALITALQHYRRPDVTVEGQNVRLWPVREREPVRLSLLHHPLCVSFSYFDSGEVVIADATAAEERFREGELVVTINKFGEVCQIAKNGGPTVDAVSLLSWTRKAHEHVRRTATYIQECLAREETEREVADFIAELSAEHESKLRAHCFSRLRTRGFLNTTAEAIVPARERVDASGTPRRVLWAQPTRCQPGRLDSGSRHALLASPAP